MIALTLATAMLAGVPDDRPVTGDAGDVLRMDEVAAMVTAAHRFLVQSQSVDGSFGLLRSESGSNAPVAVTALSVLSLMAGGSLPDHPGEEGGRDAADRAVERGIAWLVDHCLETGEEAGFFHADDDLTSRMHGQGYALLALSQAVGMYGDNARERERLHAAIRRAVGLVERTQGLHGGWWYDPVRGTHHEGSITVCMIQALRSAKDAGFLVDTAVIEAAERYMAKSQDEKTGRFRYALGDDKTTWALTAAALSTLNALGDYSSERLADGFEALRRDDPYTGGGLHEDFVSYGALYAAQSYWTHFDRRPFEAWWPAFVEDCAGRQRDNGSFPDTRYGRVYGTAITSLTLQVPLGYLPLFQR